MPLHAVDDPPALLHDGRRIETAEDVARFFGVRQSALIYTLWRASDAERYRAFEIPKRSGGMRQINAPTGLMRELQDKLAPHLSEIYNAHPSAHGFIKERSILTNAKLHTGQRLVLNVDLLDFFPSINFGRIRGLFMKPPFSLGSAAATVMAQICTHKNGLPQGAPTSPVLSNFIAASLDRRLTRLAKENNVRYSRYADDITFSTNQTAFPAPIASFEQGSEAKLRVRAGEALERAIEASGFSINQKKVRLQTRHQRQSVTGLIVNSLANIARTRVRRIRAMLHAWEKFGIDKAATEHFVAHRGMKHPPNDAGRKFRNVVYGELSFLKMIRGAEHPTFLNLCAKVLKLDPNPSRFVRQLAFGGADFELFISHASEDKDTIARPIFEACQKLGIKAFFDEAHIGWGQSFTQKINTALGAARTVLAIVSTTSVTKDWPVTEVNAALAMEVSRQKKVVPLLVGGPDLSRLPLIAAKDCLIWDGDAEKVAKRLKAALTGDAPRRPAAPPPQAPRPKGLQPLPPIERAHAPDGAPNKKKWKAPPVRLQTRKQRRSLWDILFGKRPK